MAKCSYCDYEDEDEAPEAKLVETVSVCVNCDAARRKLELRWQILERLPSLSIARLERVDQFIDHLTGVYRDPALEAAGIPAGKRH